MCVVCAHIHVFTGVHMLWYMCRYQRTTLCAWSKTSYSCWSTVNLFSSMDNEIVIPYFLISLQFFSICCFGFFYYSLDVGNCYKGSCHLWSLYCVGNAMTFFWESPNEASCSYLPEKTQGSQQRLSGSWAGSWALVCPLDLIFPLLPFPYTFSLPYLPGDVKYIMIFLIRKIYLLSWILRPPYLLLNPLEIYFF